MAKYQWRRRGTIHKNSHTGAEKTQKKRETSFPVSLEFLIFCGGLFLLKDILAHSTDGADPAVGDLVPRGARGDAVVRVACGGVVLIAAGADVLIHQKFLLDLLK